MDSLVQLANQLEREISQSSGDFAKVYNPNTPTWKDIQRHLKSDEAAIEIIRMHSDDDQILYAALILRENTLYHPDLVVLGNGDELEGKYFNYYQNVIHFQAFDKYTYNQYWKKIQEKLQGVRKIYFSPDGVFHQINVATLRNPQTNRYLIDETELILVTNTKDILNSPRKTLSNESLKAVLLARPAFKMNQNTKSKSLNKLKKQMSDWLVRATFSDLPGTEYEVREIKAVLSKNNWKALTYIGKDAREEVIKSVSNPNVLHIATHGFFLQPYQKNFLQYKQFELDDKPHYEFSDPMLRSGLLLAGVQDYMNLEKTQSYDEEDGILTAYEALSLDLDQTDLVVLSACETGLGQVRSGEGVYGLQRAFKIAGAKAVLMSLWKVDDKATQELMQIFYKKWLAHGNKRQAFQEAQQQLRDHYHKPYYWGAFVMLSD